MSRETQEGGDFERHRGMMDSMANEHIIHMDAQHKAVATAGWTLAGGRSKSTAPHKMSFPMTGWLTG